MRPMQNSRVVHSRLGIFVLLNTVNTCGAKHALIELYLPKKAVYFTAPNSRSKPSCTCAGESALPKFAWA